jgi:outer membrane protein OmpA-like peptidoglycan-associated protein
MRTATPKGDIAKYGSRTGLLVIIIVASSAAFAGDPLGVNEALSGLQSNWPQARFSIDVTGLKDEAAVVGGSLQVQYEAVTQGYLTYLRVSSHGDIVARSVSPVTSLRGTLPLPIQPPLGDEGAIFLFSAQPLPSMPSEGAQDVALGADREHATALVRRIAQLQAQGVTLVVRRIHYMVDAPVGQTQYTTRSVILRVETLGKGGAVDATPRFPTRIEFDFDSDRLTPASQRDLDVFGAAMIARPRDSKVTLEGHTDLTGSDQYDMELSVRRAAAARRYLIDSFALRAEQLQVTGKGKADPIGDNSTEAGRSQNRRVDFIFDARGATGK